MHGRSQRNSLASSCNGIDLIIITIINMNNEQEYTLQILNELLEEVFDIEFEARPKHLQNIIEEAEDLLIAKGIRYRTSPSNEIATNN